MTNGYRLCRRGDPAGRLATLGQMRYLSCMHGRETGRAGRLPPPGEMLRRALAREVRRFFHDPAHGGGPVVRSDDSLAGRDSASWRVHGNVATMMVGGVTGLLLQMLHPKVLAGVWDHSGFRADMHGRLRRTARFISVTTYGAREEAEAAIARVRAIHRHVTGTLPDGTPYAADDPELLEWVHVSETLSFLRAYVRYAEPSLPLGEQDRYFAEMAGIGARLGMRDPPRTRAAAEAAMTRLRPRLQADARTADVARRIFSASTDRRLAEPVRAVVLQAAVDLLPEWARAMHGRRPGILSGPLNRLGARGLASAADWIFAE